MKKDKEKEASEEGGGIMTEEKDDRNEELNPHMHAFLPLRAERPSPQDHSMRINPLDEDCIIPISQATLKLLDSFCGSKTYDEVITSLIQKESGRAGPTS